MAHHLGTRSNSKLLRLRIIFYFFLYGCLCHFLHLSLLFALYGLVTQPYPPLTAWLHDCICEARKASTDTRKCDCHAGDVSNSEICRIFEQPSLDLTQPREGPLIATMIDLARTKVIGD